MNTIIKLFLVSLFVSVFSCVFAQESEPVPVTQSQPLIVPEMEVHDLFGMAGREVRPGITIRSVGMATLRLSRVEITEGTSTPDHNHADEEVVLLIEGSVKAFMGDKEFILEPGQMITIPAYVQHHYEALQDSVTIEAFGPGRNFGNGAMGGG